MEITLTVNGKQVKATVDEQEMKKAMVANPKRKTGYEQDDDATIYFQEIAGSCTAASPKIHSELYDKLYRTANCYNDLTVAKNNARADALMRELRRFAAEHGGCVAPKQGRESKKFILFYNKDVGMIEYSGFYHPGCNEIAFAIVKATKAAIEAFKDELIWHFTEYDPMPEGWWEGQE